MKTKMTDRERIARIIEPHSWHLKDTGSRANHRRRESIEAADRLIAAGVILPEGKKHDS